MFDRRLPQNRESTPYTTKDGYEHLISRITLLSALPHSLEDVEISLNVPSRDYVHSQLKRHGLSPDVFWCRNQDVLDTQATRLFSMCREAGLNVVIGAGREELTAAAHTSDVVLLIAHWKGGTIVDHPADILVSPTELSETLEACVAKHILLETEVEALDGLPSSQARDKVALLLNNAIANDDIRERWLNLDDLVGVDFDSVFASSSYIQCFARTQIDDLFGEERLLPGARLELADGLWRPADIAECFPEEWSGICDFICCTSEYLADETKCMRPNALFRADSRYLRPANVFKALDEMIPQLVSHASFDDDFLSLYMRVAHECDCE